MYIYTHKKKNIYINIYVNIYMYGEIKIYDCNSEDDHILSSDQHKDHIIGYNMLFWRPIHIYIDINWCQWTKFIKFILLLGNDIYW